MEMINAILEFVNSNSTITLIGGVFAAVILFIILLNMIVVAKINRQKKRIKKSLIITGLCTVMSFLPVFIPAKAVGKATGIIFKFFK